MVRKQTRRHPEVYWIALRSSNHLPNFWMTRQYVALANLSWMDCEDLCGWVDEEDDECWFLPPLGHRGFETHHPVFACFPGERVVNGTFLDHQYIYDAHQFLGLEGSQWKVYRKNIKKYPGRTDGALEYRELIPQEYKDEVGVLLERWCAGKVLEDPETLVRFAFYGSWRWGLFRDGELVGLNIGDLNHLHAIFRYCIDDTTPYLNEYLRHCFYTSGWAQTFRWINDGGDLGNPGLERFKRRLNPRSVLQVWSSAVVNEG